MNLELISFALCPFVHRATIMLLEKNVPFSTRYIDLKNKPDWFLKISPRGKVPVLVADGTVIFESQVIVEFLDETNPPRFMPEDPFERARQRAWVEPANDLLQAGFELATAKTDDEFAKALSDIHRLGERFESVLVEPFFAGSELGIVDVAIAPALFRLVLFESRTKLRFFDASPKVGAWAKRLAARESVKRGVPEGYEDALIGLVRARGGRFAKEL